MLTRYFSHLHSLRKNLHLSSAELTNVQEKKLRAIIRHAYSNVPFYRRKFDRAGLKPDDIKSIDDLPKIPVTTKTEIQSSSLNELVAGTADPSKCVRATTSGSTGLPLTVLGDDDAGDFCSALWTRALLENGLRVVDKVAVIKNPLFFGKRRGIFKLLRRKYISVFEDADQQLDILESYKPDIIRGYASSLAMLAMAGRNRTWLAKPRYVFSGAELLRDNQRKEISSVFECDVLDYYGCVELSLLMWECSEHAGYHMNIDSVAMEFLKGQDAVSAGEQGEIVCTNLHNYVMPLIRYRLGDIGVPVDEPCPCGRTLPRTKVLKGRSDDVLITLDGKLVYASSFFYNLLGHLKNIRQFRVIHQKRDKMTIQLVLKEDLSEKTMGIIRKKIQNTFGEDMMVDFRPVDEIERDSTGKLRMVVSHVPMKLFHK